MLVANVDCLSARLRGVISQKTVVGFDKHGVYFNINYVNIDLGLCMRQHSVLGKR
jgi:hypothetical protein